jgi:hypothetical protein
MRQIGKRMLFLIILLTGFFQSAYSQAEFIITDARRNDQDITEWALNNGAKIVFYVPEDSPGEVFMSNYMSVANTQSWGRTYEMNKEHFDETETSFETDVFTFKWSYQNSYDTKKGTAQVSLTKIFKPQGVVVSIQMITESLDILEYKGYLEGTLQF